MTSASLLRKHRLSMAAALLCAAAGSYVWTILHSPELQVRHRLWQAPTIERSVRIASDPVRAVGGSRDASVLIAATREPKDVKAVHDTGYPTSKVSLWAPTGSRILQQDFNLGTVEDVDVSSQDPVYFLISCSSPHLGRAPDQAERFSGGFRPHLALFSSDERQAIFAGGWYTHPGCTMGESARSLMLLEEYQRRHHHPARLNSLEVDALPGLHAADNDIGIASLGWSPAGDVICGVGVDSIWAQESRRAPADEVGCVAMLKAWKSPSLEQLWEKRVVPQQGMGKEALDGNRGIPLGHGILEVWKHPLPAFCRFLDDGRTIIVGWGRHDSMLREIPLPERQYTSVGRLPIEFQKIEFRDASNGGVVRAPTKLDPVPQQVFALELVGVLREEIIAVTPHALWRQPIDGGEWKRFEIPDAGDITVVKTTRDRKHLLVGDSRGAVHVLRWP